MRSRIQIALKITTGFLQTQVFVGQALVGLNGSTRAQSELNDKTVTRAQI